VGKVPGEVARSTRYETSQKPNGQGPEYSTTALDGYLDNAIRLWNVALILEDLELYEEAEERFREAKGAVRRRLERASSHVDKHG
jgi:hypothetical protein